MTTTAPPRVRRKAPPPHGDHRRYRYWECRCPRCRDGERVYCKRHREHRAVPGVVNPTATVRRIRGLIAMGYTYAALGRHLNTSDSWVYQLARADTSRPAGLHRHTADQVIALCHRLAALPPPSGPTAKRARGTARKYGWHPLVAWDDIDDPAAVPDLGAATDHLPDPEVVRRAVRGLLTYGQLDPADRVAVYARMVAVGMGTGTIRRQLAINGETLRKLAGQVAA